MGKRKAKSNKSKLFLIFGLIVTGIGILSLLLLTPTKQALKVAEVSAPANLGFGVMGDSNSDEYRADDNRGGQYADTTFNWVEILVRKRAFNFGAWGSWGGPRRTGYEYNWARSGDRAADLSSQLSGLAEQVGSGKVNYVFIHIGSNDFHLKNGTYQDIYSGKLSGSSLQSKLDGIYQNIANATNGVLSRGAKVVLTTVGDPGTIPTAYSSYPDATKRAKVTAAIEEVNTRLKNAFNNNSQVAIVDLTTFSNSLLGRVVDNRYIVIGGEKIDLTKPGNDPHYLQLGDSSQHPGTIASGLFANSFLSALTSLGLNIAPLTDQELLEAAGLRTAPSSPIPSPSLVPADRKSPAPTGCYYEEVQCVRAPCNPVLVCPRSPSPSPSPTSTLTPSPTPYPSPSIYHAPPSPKASKAPSVAPSSKPRSPVPSAAISSPTPRASMISISNTRIKNFCERYPRFCRVFRKWWEN